jgi:hypothetical protein
MKNYRKAKNMFKYHPEQYQKCAISNYSIRINSRVFLFSSYYYLCLFSGNFIPFLSDRKIWLRKTINTGFGNMLLFIIMAGNDFFPTYTHRQAGFQSTLYHWIYAAYYPYLILNKKVENGKRRMCRVIGSLLRLSCVISSILERWKTYRKIIKNSW